MTDLCKSLDSQTFAKFLSNLDELKADVLENKNHTLTPQSFFPFLDSLKKLEYLRVSKLSRNLIRNMPYHPK